MMPGMLAFWALARTQTRRLTCARAPEAAETAAQKEQPASQPGNAKARKHRSSSVLWLGPRPKTNARKSKDRAAREPATAKAKRTEQQPHRSAKHFLTVLTAFCRARTQHRRHARQRLAPKCAKMSLAYIPPIPSKKQCFLGFGRKSE